MRISSAYFASTINEKMERKPLYRDLVRKKVVYTHLDRNFGFLQDEGGNIYFDFKQVATVAGEKIEKGMFLFLERGATISGKGKKKCLRGGCGRLRTEAKIWKDVEKLQ